MVIGQENTAVQEQGQNLKSSLIALKNQFNIVREYISSVFVAGVDFGAIPNKDQSKLRNTLLLPGAEKIIVLLRLQVYYELIEKTLDFDRNYIDFEYRCTVTTNESSFAVEAFASCNSREKGFPQSTENYKVDAFQYKDNISKKARKRALIDAVQKISGIRDYFNQDFFPIISLDKDSEKKRQEQEKKNLENKLGYAVSQISQANAKNFKSLQEKYKDLKDLTEFKQAVEQKALELAEISSKKNLAIPKEASINSLQERILENIPKEKIEVGSVEVKVSEASLVPEVVENTTSEIKNETKTDIKTDDQLTKEALAEISTATTVDQLKAIKDKYNGLSKRSPEYKKALESKICLLLNNLLAELKNDLDNCNENATLKFIISNSKYDSLRVHPEYKEYYLELIGEVKDRITPPAPKKEIIKAEPVQAELLSENDMLPKFEADSTTEIKQEKQEIDLAERLKKDLFEYNLSKNTLSEMIEDINEYHKNNPSKSIDFAYNFLLNRFESYLMQINICKNLEDLHSFENAMSSYIDLKSIVTIVKNKREYFTVLYKADNLLSSTK